jgi:hypothetical protein
MSITMRARLQCPRHVSRQSSTVAATRPALPHPRVSACSRCEPPRLVTRRLRSFSQVLTLVLHCFRSIGTNPHDLHIRRRPPSLCSTSAQRNLTDMVAHTKSHILISPLTIPECYSLIIIYHQTKKKDKSTSCSC